MTILGIVAEYDPFHNGHLHHLREAQARIRPDLTYIVLSPCLKQRGTLAFLSPSDRAALALEAGADAVFSLPVLWTVRDAEHYALGSVALLANLGATHLAFGAEDDNLDLLQRIAELLESPSVSFKTCLKEKLSEGEGYPSALSSAVRSVLPEAGSIPDQPNNILALCYLRALIRLNCRLSPVIIRRNGSYHDMAVHPDSPSASAVRRALIRGNYDETYRALPAFAADLIRRRLLERRLPDPLIQDTILLSRLRSMTADEYALLPDLSEGLENALRNAAQAARSRDEIIRVLTGARYPSSRISRLCAYAMLHLSQSDFSSLPLPDSALLLGLKKNPDMTAMWKELPFPVFSSFTEWKKAAHPADLAAWRLWAQCCSLPDTLPFTEKTISF